ncbi:MAG: cardiolipin synthase [Candidatus Glassbacteria bacterium]
MELEKITSSKFHRGNEIEILQDGDSAFPEMLSAIRGASKYVLIEFYIFRDDPVGKMFTDVLIEVAQRGVEVKLLYDSCGCRKIRKSFWERVSGGGVDVRSFHPLCISKLGQYIHRDHRKILVVDGEVGFTGGMNLGQEYWAMEEGAVSWRDLMVSLRGPAVGDLIEVFRESWVEAGGKWFLLEEYGGSCGGGERRVITLSNASSQRALSLRKAYLLGIHTAQEEIYIMDPYFVPGRSLISGLKSAVRRGVDVRLLLPGKSDVTTVKFASEALYEELLSSGIKIYEKQGTILHGKATIIDGYWTIIGSSNLDPRSFNFNYECNFGILDEEISREMMDAYRRDLLTSREVSLEEWKKRPLIHKALERVCSLLGEQL